ncbi:ComF family protein [Pedobacter sp. Leaf176]|uniref:ComF family protein n=1 Tax=Pedobacter sp. Leaf176 TaxID=1736286 RepID=UPI0006F90F46|nr:ComF family protein [Pedobacter sp. Leaf176]KQR72143.1 amidophosphoribosyltransferase [Pedobacter sp. Leaf176]
MEIHQSSKSQFRRWVSDLIGLLFPNLCNACGINLFRSEHLICTKCLYDLPFTDYHIHAENRVAKQLWGRTPFHAAMALLYFRKGAKVQNLIHNLKYNNKTDVGILLGNLLGERLKVSPIYQNIDLIIPVPLHHKKIRSRGYNQSAFIASGTSEKLDVIFNDSILTRNKATDTQTKKNRYSRYENMRGVFEVPDPEIIKDKHILLIDDVITTGATLEACAYALMDNGASKISIAALAFAE